MKKLFFIIFFFIFCLFINFKKKKKYNLYNGKYWDGYRLGDILYRGGGGFHMLIKSIDERWVNSIAYKYKNNPNYNKQKYGDVDLNYLINIIDNFEYEKPPSNTLVIHLRIGDVIGMKNNNENHYWMNGVNHYVKDKKYYKEILKKIKKYKIKNIHIITGSHFNNNIEESTKFIDEIIDIFEKKYHTKLIITNNPDKDFVYMINSKYFCPSGGNFTTIIKNIVLKKNNIIIQ